jgi:hypothetical protein
MKEITECIGDIGRANSTIFSTLDLTSGFWQMLKNHNRSQLSPFRDKANTSGSHHPWAYLDVRQVFNG